MELTNALRKTYASLSTTKGRNATGLFMAQGSKCVLDTIDHFELEVLLATDAWVREHPDYASRAMVVRKSDLERISSLSTAPDCIAVYQMPPLPLDFTPNPDELALALDCIQDPGNLGTIIRVADWMGVRQIWASDDTADVWNPKVVQATMGAISRVQVSYVDLPDFLYRAAQQGLPVYGTFLNGENIYTAPLTTAGIIVMGNEGNGISPLSAESVTHRLYIPSYPPGSPTSESLNVAIATAITLSEFRRRTLP